MRITESRVRQIIREEAMNALRPGNSLNRIKLMCEMELMDKSLTMRGPPTKFMQDVVDELNNMMGEDRAELIIFRHMVRGNHHDALRAIQWIRDFCKANRSVDQEDLDFRVMCLEMISRALSGINGFKVKVDLEGLPEPHPGGALGAEID